MPIATAIVSILLSLLAGTAGAVEVYRHAPVSWLESSPAAPLPGSTITTINGSDTLSSSRTVINTNFSNLNADKIEATVATLNSLTSATSLSTLSALSSVGTITTGTWSATAISAAKGGTGLTSYAAGDILYASGSSALSRLAIGSNGKVLGISGGIPSWQSVTTDTTQAYSWTGINNFVGAATYVKNLYASTTSANPLVLNTLSYTLPSTRAASSTVLSEDGNGNLTFEPGHQVYSAAFIAGSTATNAYATTSLMSLPAGLMTASSTIETSGNFSCIGTSGTACDVYLRDGTGATFATFQVASAAGGSGSSPRGTFSFKVLPTFTASAQTTVIQTSIVGLDFTGGGSTAVISGINMGGSGTSAIALASAFTLNIVIRSEGAAAQASLQSVSAIVRQ